ncbi:hypothetical protein CEXT_522071 [Caerostris extrusa]|uniref:Uncharacterized protein n=1 Tax=Caerostris extrusa TaxID=172846 RepID=A0AAV4XZK7_CAEEX|nr:hypothetical protein CEXT_522071 [Caerostris extrusa]
MASFIAKTKACAKKEILCSSFPLITETQAIGIWTLTNTSHSQSNYIPVTSLKNVLKSPLNSLMATLSENQQHQLHNQLLNDVRNNIITDDTRLRTPSRKKSIKNSAYFSLPSHISAKRDRRSGGKSSQRTSLF